MADIFFHREEDGVAVLAGEASDRTRLQRTALFPEDSNLARCCFAVTAVSCEAGGEKSAQRLVEDDCHPNCTREQLSVDITLLSHLTHLEESARGVGGCNSFRSRFYCIFSAVKERNSWSRISLQPLSVTVISSSHLQLEKKGGDMSVSVSPRFSRK